jgi:hypothetical protein
VKKVVLVAFNSEFMCFVHVLLNALDMESRGLETKIVIEGAATGFIPELVREGNPLHPLYKRVKERQLIHAVCRACATKMQTLEAVDKEGLPLADQMAGHPSLAAYMEQGYEVITF